MENEAAKPTPERLLKTPLDEVINAVIYTQILQ